MPRRVVVIVYADHEGVYIWCVRWTFLIEAPHPSCSNDCIHIETLQ